MNKPPESMNLIEKLWHYLELKADFALLSVQVKLVNGLVKTLLLLITTVLGFMVLLFGSLGLAFYISSRTDSAAGGFLWVGGGYLLLTGLALLLRRYLRNIIMMRITGFLNSLDDDRQDISPSHTLTPQPSDHVRLQPSKQPEKSGSPRDTGA